MALRAISDLVFCVALWAILDRNYHVNSVAASTAASGSESSRGPTCGKVAMVTWESAMSELGSKTAYLDRWSWRTWGEVATLRKKVTQLEKDVADLKAAMETGPTEKKEKVRQAERQASRQKPATKAATKATTKAATKAAKVRGKNGKR